MGVLTGVRANLRSARQLYLRMHERHGRAAPVYWHLLQAVSLRAYRKLAYAVNDLVLQRWITPRRFVRFQDGIASQLGGHFYVIVMPHTLHFLLPCLALVARDVRVVLLLNGAADWEAKLLRQRWPGMPQFRVATLPCSSVGHGAMINLLLRHNERDFGLLDHDLYLFDRKVLAQLRFSDEEFLLCLLSDASGGWTYPLTHFLYFRIGVFARLMKDYQTGAQIYRKLPPLARGQLLSLGLHEGRPMKAYHDFFDTLHVLIALAYAEGMRVNQVDADVYHLGGTSIGTQHTKDLMQLYIHLCFLELVAEPLLQQRYASFAAPFKTAAELRPRLQEDPELIPRLEILDRLLGRLRSAG